MKKELEEELEKRDAKMRRVEADFAVRYTDLKKQHDKAAADAAMFEDLFKDAKTELEGLTTVDNRIQNYESLQKTFKQISRYIKEAEDEKIKQMKTLD